MLHDVSEAQKLVRLYWNPCDLIATQLIKVTGRFGVMDYQDKLSLNSKRTMFK